MSRLSGFALASAAINPASMLDGDEEAFVVTVPGAKLGDFAFVSFSIDVSDLELSAQVTAANTVTVSLSNSTSGTIDLGAGTLRVKVVPFDVM
jgi:hypothetical protein